MVSLLQNYKGNIEVDGLLEQGKPFHIILKSNTAKQKAEKSEDLHEYKITVKSYMTKQANPGFDFMAKFNNDIPMPLVTMTGVKIKETKGMEYWELHGQAEKTVKCLRCGRVLTNPTSKLYGIGPECITKVPTLSNIDVNNVDEVKQKLVDVKWQGWIIRSAILEKEEV